MPTSTTTTTTQQAEKAITVTPTSLWKALPIEGEIPAPYKTDRFGFEVVPLHPTFACELKGVDFSRPITSDEAGEIREVADKVRRFDAK